MTQIYERADKGNVALTGEIDLAACAGKFVLALAFGTDSARSGPSRALPRCWMIFTSYRKNTNAISDCQKTLASTRIGRKRRGPFLPHQHGGHAAHDGKSLTGAVAGLAVPWGLEAGDEDRLKAGYHLVWPRDLVETAGGLLAARRQRGCLAPIVLFASGPGGRWTLAAKHVA